MEEKPITGALTMYRSLGDYLCRLEQYEKAKHSYDMAYKDFPGDVRLLLARSQACSLAMQPEEAFHNADLALKLEPRNQTAVNVQARALYTMKEFERSLTMNYRGYTIRTQPPYFHEGINQGLHTLQECVGTGSDHVLSEYLPLIKNLEARHYFDGQEPPKPLRVSRVPRDNVKPKLTQDQIRKERTLARVMAMKYLGAMADDKFYLENLINDERLESANAAGTRDLIATAKQALDMLVQRQDMLRTQRPYYSIKYAEASTSSYQEYFKQLVLKKERNANLFTAKILYKQLKYCLAKKRVDLMVKQATRMQTFLDMKTPRTLPSKDNFITSMYNVLGNGFLSQFRLSHSMSSRGNRRRVMALMNIPVGRPRSFDSVLCCGPAKLMSPKRASERYGKMLEICENPTQRCWLYYELSRMMCIQQNFSNAKYYSRRCMEEADELEDSVWWMLGSLASMSPMLIQKNLNELREHIKITMPRARETSFFDQLKCVFEACEQLASEPDDMDERKANLQRQKQILRLEDGQERADHEVLFKRMLTLPSGRMFRVLPSRDTGGKWAPAERRQRKQIGISVVPGAPITLPAPRKAAIRGYQYFE